MIPTSPPSAPEPREMSDAELENCIKKIAAGEKEALSGLYYDTHAAVYGLALSLLKNPHDAEDVMQEVYIRIWESAPNYQAMGKPLAWIFTIARNQAMMSIRAKERTSPKDPAELGTGIGEENLSDPEERIVLNAVMGTLKEEEQMVVILHAVAGMKHREIAEILGVKLSTVLSRYNRALKKLRRALKEAE